MRPRTRSEPRPGRAKTTAPKEWPDAVRAFLDHHRLRRRSELTLRWYQADLDQFAAWYRKARGCEPGYRDIDAEDMLDFQEHLAGKVIKVKDGRTGKMVPAREPKPATVNRRLSAVKSLIAWAVRNRYREEVLDAPPNVKQEPRAIKSLDAAQQAKLLKEIGRRGDRRARAVVLILIHTGLRVREFCGLSWIKVDLTRGRSAVTIEGKGGKIRTVELSRDGRTAFLDLRKRIADDHGPDHLGPLDPVLVSARRDAAGGPVPLGTQGLQKMLAPYAAVLGLKKLTPHMLRHTFATNHMRDGTPLPVIQYWMGHSRLETTGIYMQSGPEERRRAMDRFQLPEVGDD
jgi:integrase/recombinase XerC